MNALQTLFIAVIGWCMGRLSLYIEDKLNDRRRKRGDVYGCTKPKP